MCMAVIFVTLRIGGKIVAHKLGGDDVILVAALALTIAPLTCLILSKISVTISRLLPWAYFL